MSEIFLNQTSWTLSGPLGLADTTLTVAAVAGSLDAMPSAAAAGTMSSRVRIGGEILNVTGTSNGGLTWTVVRGTEGTTAATALAGATVAAVVTKTSLLGLGSYLSSEGVYSNLPVPGLAGRVIYSFDSPLAYFDNGASLNTYGPIYPLVPPPPSSAWTQTNIGPGNGAVLSFANGCPTLYTANSPGGGDSLAILSTPMPAGGVWSVQAMILPHFGVTPVSASRAMGLCFFDSTTSSALCLAIETKTGTAQLAGYMYATPTSFAGYNALSATAIDLGSVRFLRLSLNQGLMQAFTSTDGIHYIPTYLVGTGNLGTASNFTPDSAGIYVNPSAPLCSAGLSLLHWSVAATA